MTIHKERFNAPSCKSRWRKNMQDDVYPTNAQRPLVTIVKQCKQENICLSRPTSKWPERRQEHRVRRSLRRI